MKNIVFVLVVFCPLITFCQQGELSPTVEMIYEIPHVKGFENESYYDNLGNIPYSFDIDSANNIYLPDNITDEIKIYNNGKIINKFPCMKNTGTIRYDKYHNTLFVKSRDFITQYSLNGKEIDKYQFEYPGGSLLNIEVDSNFVYSFAYKVDSRSANVVYFIHKYRIDTHETNIIKVKNYQDEDEMTFSPKLLVVGNSMFTSFDDAVYKIAENGMLYKTEVVGIGFEDGLLYFDGTYGLTGPTEYSLIIKSFDIHEGVKTIYDITPIVERILNGKLGQDFMYGPLGNIYEVRYQNGILYLMGSDKKNTYIFKIELE